jgi:hypothetical protein
MMLLGDCYSCHKLFYSNPDYVPSLRLENGDQAIFCQQCVAAANRYRKAHGEPEHYVHPDAYEPTDNAV